MRCANGDDSLHHLLAMLQYAELQVESSDHILGSDMVYLIPNPLICGPCKGLLDALQKFGWMLRYRDHRISAAYSWGSFCAGSWGYFLTVI